MQGVSSYGNPLDDIPRNAFSPPDIDLGGSEDGMAGRVLRIFERRIQELPEAERDALNRRAQSQMGLRIPNRPADRGRDYGASP